MAAKEPMIVSLIDLNHIGALAGKEKVDDGRVKLTIRKPSKNPLPFSGTETLPYHLDEDQDIEKKHTDRFGQTWILKPLSPPPSVEVEETPYHVLADNADLVQELQNKVKDLNKELGVKEKELEREKGEGSSSGSSSSSGPSCRECGKIYPTEVWNMGGGRCPNCGSSNPENSAAPAAGTGPSMR